MTERTLSCEPLLATLAAALAGLQARLAPAAPVVVGVQTGGWTVAQELHRRVGFATPPVPLNVNFHRDDFARAGLRPQVSPSEVAADLDGRTVILVDDVLFTGRTARAALNELFEYGRPARVFFAALLDRGECELPIRADFLGGEIRLDKNERIKLRPDAPLRFVVEADDEAPAAGDA